MSPSRWPRWRGTLGRWNTDRWFPHTAALLVLVLVTVAAFYAANATNARTRMHVAREVQRTEDAIEQRMAAYIAMLRGGAGLLAATGDFTRDQFNAYVSRLDLARAYPGVQGIGVVRRITPDDLPSLTTRMRAEGFKGFRVWPPGVRSEYHATVYLEPLDRRNRVAIGYDMFTEATRRSAMARARDTGQPAASGRVTLTQEIDEPKQPGFLIYVPVYRGGRIPDTVGERRAALIGFVYSPFRAVDLLEATLGQQLSGALHVSVHDGEAGHADSLLYHSAGAPDPGQRRDASARLDVAGRTWTLVFTTLPGFAWIHGLEVGGLIVLGGLIISWLLFAMTRAEARGRRIAEASAAELAESVVRERRARQHAEQFAVISRALNVTLDTGQLGEMIVTGVRTLAEMQAAVLYEIDAASGDLRVVACSGDVGPDLVPGSVIPRDTGTVGRAVRERKTVATANFLEDPEIAVPAALYQKVARATYRSVLAMPLIAHDRLIGALAFGGAVGRTFTGDEMRLGEAFASQAALALENARLFQEAGAARVVAEQANRTKDDFLATVSHELRTPLNAILGWARILRSPKLDSRKAAQALEVIERNAVAQAQLVNDLLDVSRVATGKLQLEVHAVEVDSVIAAAVDAVRPEATAKGVELHTTGVPAPSCRVRGDAARLEQVVWNLLTNAVKFTPAGGRIDIALARSGAHVEIVVTDTGAGIAPDVLPHIFERFRQAHAGSTRTHGGLGIGLSLVRNLVELHGGTVSGTSEGEGKGAAFVVRLPALEDSARAAPRAPHQRPVHAPMQLPSLDGLRILAVDDEPDSLDVVAEVLTRAGADVRRARSASAALSLVDGWQPDVLLSDIEMPGEDGYAFIARFRQRVGGDGIPAIAVTAYGRVEDRQRALAAGFVEHVTKPVDPAQLVTAVASLVRHRAA